MLVEIYPFPIDESVPQEDEVEWSIRHLRRHRLGGTSWILEEHLQGFMAAVTREKYPDTCHWDRVFDLDQTAFRDSTLPRE